MRRSLFFIIIGLGGAAILVSLGVWQVQRLAWKQAIIADIEARIDAEPVALPDAPDPARDAYLPVEASGTWADGFLRVLVSQKEIGAGYRIIAPLETAQGRILVDRGFIPTDADVVSVTGQVTLRGNLQWPQESDGFTPAPDLARNIWFARDVDAMASVLETRPLLVVAREVNGESAGVMPLPVETAGIPNDHLQYAITWFSLAALWLAMSLTFVMRRKLNVHSKG